VRHGVRAATDITGFGLLGHASQMAEASGVSFVLAPRADWFLPRVLELAVAGEVAGGLQANRAFYAAKVDDTAVEEAIRLGSFDPQTSGGLLLAVPARRAGVLVAALRRRRLWVREVGFVVKRRAHAVVCTAAK